MSSPSPKKSLGSVRPNEYMAVCENFLVVYAFGMWNYVLVGAEP